MKALCFALNVTRSQWGELRFLFFFFFFLVVPSGVLSWSRHIFLFIFYALKSDLYTMHTYSSSVTTAASPHDSSRVATLISSFAKWYEWLHVRPAERTRAVITSEGVNQIEPASFSSRLDGGQLRGRAFNSTRLHVCLLTRGFDLTKSSRMLIWRRRRRRRRRRWCLLQDNTGDVRPLPAAADFIQRDPDDQHRWQVMVTL